MLALTECQNQFETRLDPWTIGLDYKTAHHWRPLKKLLASEEKREERSGKMKTVSGELNMSDGDMKNDTSRE
jgi:hypothetical protein